jgi:hypothetical protein
MAPVKPSAVFLKVPMIDMVVSLILQAAPAAAAMAI